MESLPTMDDLGNEPAVEELSKSITAIAHWKAPGSDGVPADLLNIASRAYYPSYMTF